MTKRPPSRSAVQASQGVRAVTGRLRRRILDAADPEDISFAQASVLARLSGNDGLTVSDLAAAEGVRHQSMSAIVTPLAGLGLVQRRPDPTDGRRQLIVLTAAGRRRVEEGRRARGEWLAGQLQDKCTEAERQTVIAAMAILERLIHD
ncbi:MarR family winged helix-turn-helix transcriptional regulator [Amycolatopsis pithecellobii]|uniref:MarR family transcriptional regulator n=1 Tax=Amycolatopsis pithecellobii TaxID=664692 RepID=A0A6N7Z1C6_9PSEU|nr:MarR family transcriptional regulator [Amycolatopsis pithecellobii]MTD53324.1 MarR family transcriptional regulator [Amycolatopsis pithecellobii]